MTMHLPLVDQKGSFLKVARGYNFDNYEGWGINFSKNEIKTKQIEIIVYKGKSFQKTQKPN